MARSMWESRLSALVLAAAALAAAGCGGGSGQAVNRSGTLDLALDEYRILPAKIEIGTGTIVISARNRGVLTHNVVVQVPAKSEEDRPVELGRTPTAHPGQTVQTSIRLQPGTYRLVCTIANHENLGQYATVEVK
jgi:plastocyanin